MISPYVRRRWEVRAVLAVLAATGLGLAPVEAFDDEFKLVTVVAALDEEQREERATKLVAEARAAFARGDNEAALAAADQAVKAAPDAPQGYAVRGSLNTALRRHEASLPDYDRLVMLQPDDPNRRDQRGAAYFCAGRFAEAVADFDKAVELDAARGPGHWRRGIAYYFDEKYDEGRRQFEGYQEVDDSDVENAVWRFLCMARKDGFEAAQTQILKIGDDRRVPMRAIYELFAGKGSEEAVLAACQAGNPSERELNDRKFYAHQYLGLYKESRREVKAARLHMEKAVAHKIPHYMYDVAVVHLQRLSDSPKATPRE